jgi:hypothetical protein
MGVQRVLLGDAVLLADEERLEAVLLAGHWHAREVLNCRAVNGVVDDGVLNRHRGEAAGHALVARRAAVEQVVQAIVVDLQVGHLQKHNGRRKKGMP